MHPKGAVGRGGASPGKSSAKSQTSSKPQLGKHSLAPEPHSIEQLNLKTEPA